MSSSTFYIDGGLPLHIDKTLQPLLSPIEEKGKDEKYFAKICIWYVLRFMCTLQSTAKPYFIRLLSWVKGFFERAYLLSYFQNFRKDSFFEILSFELLISSSQI